MRAKSTSCPGWKADSLEPTAFTIATLNLEGGSRIGICPLPGRHNALEADVAAMLEWDPVAVLSMTELPEMHAAGSSSLGEMLVSAGVEWRHLPVRDYGGLGGAAARAWPNLSSTLHSHLDAGKGVLVHCHGGQGRSGMIALRLMVERGENPDAALKRLRGARPGAVETDEQRAWALRSKTSSA